MSIDKYTIGELIEEIERRLTVASSMTRYEAGWFAGTMKNLGYDQLLGNNKNKSSAES